MSQNIDQRIVEMKFDNAQFEKSVKQTISSLEQLEEALNFEDAAQSFQKVEDAANDIDLSHLESSVDQISDRFTNMGILGMQVMERLSNKVIDLGVNLTKSLTVNQLGAGWGKYESLMEASQVMVNNTRQAGESTEEAMARVQPAINKMLDYTDATSYSFDQLISTLGKFTSAGIPLEEAVYQVQGIANWAATAGISAQRAAPAFYNLAQAAGSGALKATDWKSLELLNMQTPDFFNKAIETGLAVGTIVDAGNGYFRSIYDKNGKYLFNAVEGFRDSLSTGWFDKNVISGVLMAYGKVYNDDGTLNEFAANAYNAAYQAKTFTDAVNAAKDAVSTGWTKTFQAMFGDFSQAAEFFTNIADYLIEIFNGGEALRNQALTFWKDAGGREEFINSLYQIFEIIIAIKDTIHEAIFNVLNPARQTLEGNDKFLSDAAWMAKNILRVTHGIASVIQGIYDWLVGVFEPIEEVMHTIADEAEYIQRTIIDPAGNVITYMTAVSRTVSETADSFVDAAGNMQWHFSEIRETADGVSNAFVDMTTTSNAAVKNLEKASTVAVDEKLAQEIYDTFPREIKDIIKNGYEVDYKRTSNWINEDKWWDYQQALTGVDQTDNKLLSHAYGEFGYYQKKALDMIEAGTLTRDQVDTSKWTKAHLKAWEEYWAVRDRMDAEASAAMEKTEETEVEASEVTVMTGGRLEKLQRILQGVVAVFNVAKRVISGVVKGVGKLLLKLTPLIDIFLDIGAFIGDILVYADMMGQKIEDTIGAAFAALGELIRPVFQSISNWLKNVFGDFSTPEARAERLQSLISKISGAFTWINEHVRPVVDSVTGWFSDQFKAVKAWAEGTTLYQALSRFFSAEEIETVDKDGNKVVKTVTVLDKIWGSVSGVITDIESKIEEFKKTPFYATLSDIFSTKIVGKTGRPEDGDEAYIYETFFDRLITKIAAKWEEFKQTDFYKDMVKAGNTVSEFFTKIFGVEKVGRPEDGDERYVTVFTRISNAFDEFQKSAFWQFFVNAGNTIGEFFTKIFSVEKVGRPEDGDERYVTVFTRISDAFDEFQKSAFWQFFVNAGNTIGEFFTKIFGVEKVGRPEDGDERYVTVFTRISNAFDQFKKSEVYKFIENYAGQFFEKINAIFGNKPLFDEKNNPIVDENGVQKVETFWDRLNKLFAGINGFWEEFTKTPFYQALSRVKTSISEWISNFIGDMGDPTKRAERFAGLAEKFQPITDFFTNIFNWISDQFGFGEKEAVSAEMPKIGTPEYDQWVKSQIHNKDNIVASTGKLGPKPQDKTNVEDNSKEASSFWKTVGVFLGDLIKNIIYAVGEIKKGIEETTGLDVTDVINKAVSWILRVVAAVFLLKGIWAMLSFVQHFNQRARSVFTEIASIIAGIASAIAIMALAVTVFSKMDPTELERGKAALNSIMLWLAGIMVVVLSMGIIMGTRKTNPKMLEAASKNINAVANVLRSIGVSVALMAISIAIIGRLKTEEYTQGANTLWIILGVLFVMTVIITAMAALIKPDNKNIANRLKGTAFLLSSIGASVLMLAVSMHILGSFDDKAFETAAWRTAAVLGVVLIVAGLLIWFSSKCGTVKGKTEQLPKNMASIAAIIASIGVTVGILAASMLIMAYVPEDAFLRSFLAVALLMIGIGTIAVLLVKESSKIKKNASKQIGMLIVVLLSVVLAIATLVAGLVVLSREGVDAGQMIVYFLGISVVLGVLLGVVVALDKANIGAGAIKGAFIFMAVVGIIFGGLALIAKLLSSTAKSVINDISQALRQISYAIGSSKDMLNGATKEDFQPIADILKMFAKLAVDYANTDFMVLSALSGQIWDVCTEIGNAVDALPDQGFKTRFDELFEVLDQFKTKATEYETVTFGSIGNITWYIGQLSAGLKSSTTLMSEAMNLSGALDWGLSVIERITTAANGASAIQDLTNLPVAMTNLGSAISLFFGLLTNKDEDGSIIDTSGKVDVDNIASIFTQLAAAMPDNTTIGQISSYASGGDNDMTKFALGIVAIGEAMKQYQDKVQFIESSKLEPAQQALLYFQTLNNDLRGGNVQQATSEASLLNGTLQSFGNDIQLLGTSLKGYYDMVDDFDKTKFQPAEDMLEFFRKLKNKLTGMDEEGNINTFMTNALPGPQIIGVFGREIQQVGQSIFKYYNSVRTLTWDKVRDSLQVLDFFNGLQRRLPRLDSFLTFFIGHQQTLSELGSEIGQVGTDLQNFVDGVLGIKDGEKAEGKLTMLDGNVRTAMDATLSILERFAEIQATINPNETTRWRLADLFYDIGHMFSQYHLDVLNLDKLTEFGKSIEKWETKKAIGSIVDFLSAFADVQAKLGIGSPYGYIRLGGFIKSLVGKDDGLMHYLGNNELQNFINAASSIEVQDTKALVGLLTDWANLESIINHNAGGTGYLPILTENMVGALQALGFDLATEIANGIDSEDATTAIGLSMVALKDAAYNKGTEQEYKDSLEPVGKYLAEGLANGITNNAGLVETAIRGLLSNFTITPAKEEVESNSPSKVFYRLGMYIDEGLAMGIDDYANVVAVSTSDVSQDALDRAKTILADISNGLTDDISGNPTITPVLDMSNISSGMSSIDGMFGSRTIGVNAERVRGMIGSTERSTPAAYNDANVIQAISDVNERLNALNENIAAMQIVLDTGVLTGALAPKIDRYLGRQARRN